MTHTPKTCWFQVSTGGTTHTHLGCDEALELLERVRESGAGYRYTFHSMTAGSVVVADTTS